MFRRRIAVISVILAIVLTFGLAGCGSDRGGGSSGSIKSLINNFFDAIDKQDVDKFLNCLEKDAADELLDNVDEDELEDLLKAWDEEFNDEFGKNWRKKVEIGDAEEVDEDDDVVYYEVEVSLDGEDDTIPVIKVKRKYYLDSDYADAFVSSGIGGGGGGGGAAAVVNDYFDAIYERDLKKMLNCVDEEARREILDMYDEEYLQEDLERLAMAFENYGGENWRKKVKVGKAEEIGEEDGILYYEVEIEFEGNKDYVEVKKVKGKYYIDQAYLY